MSLITVLKVSLTFFENQIFRDIGLQVEPGDRIGLVGPNGSGKTTLLRLLMGEVSPDSGEVRVARETRIGYLPQDIQEGLSGPLLHSVIDSIPGRVLLKKRLTKTRESLEEAPRKQEQARLAEKMAEIHHKIDSL
jgi:ATP-binding cassette subfamily F protein 3